MDSNSDSDLYADDLSQISSDAEFPDLDSDSDEELFRPRRNRVLPLPSSSDSEDSDDEVLDWSTIDNVPIIEQFLGQSGVFVMPNNSESVIDVVKLFIEDDLFEYMATETNRYREQNSDAFRDRAKSVKWKDVNMVDLKKMLGLLLLMGRIRKDTRDEYWSTDITIQTPIFAEVMSRDRFRQIWYAWHFSNNDDRDDRDRLKKIRPIISYFLPKFQEVYKPERELSLDESIMPWRGRLSFKVYNASKVVKYGLLIRMVCEAKTGYICNFRMYCGQGSHLQETILNLLEPYSNLWHHVYMDNYYNSVATCELLLQHSFRTCGTIRVNRGLPSCLKDPKLARGESIFRRRQNILLQCWQSKRTVRMISTIHSADIEESHNIDWATKQRILKPICVIDYNKYMKGVDHADQYLSYYSIVRRTKKWTKRTVMFFINCALFNAFRVFKVLNPHSKKKYKMFLHDVAKEWIKESLPGNIDDPVPSTSATSSRRDPPGRLSKDPTRHKLVKITTGGTKLKPQRQCRVCAAHKKKSLTCYLCEFCKVSLHRGDCFFKYHTHEKY